MGMISASLLRFMQAADATMEALFPAVIKIAGQNYQCTGVGGAAMMEYAEEGGQVPAGLRVFRLSKVFIRLVWKAAPPSSGSARPAA